HGTLYETIGALEPTSATEIGCGGGDHLHNLSVLYPAMHLRGLDRSPGQIELLKQRSPHLSGIVNQCDITKSLPPELHGSAKIAYSQAVIMHIQRKTTHLDALANMFTIARNQVVLMENWWRHWFMDDILELHAQGRLPWRSLNLYFRRIGA